MSIRLHRKVLKSGYPWELGVREHEGGFSFLTLQTSILSEFCTVNLSSNKHCKCSLKKRRGALSLPFCLHDSLYAGSGLYWEYIKPFQGVYGHQELEDNQFLDPNFCMYPYLKLITLGCFQPAFAALQFFVSLFLPRSKYYYNCSSEY